MHGVTMKFIETSSVRSASSKHTTGCGS